MKKFISLQPVLVSARITLAVLLLFTPTACKKHKSNRAGHEMQDFIVELSEYAKSNDADFAIIPQNGVELLFNNLDSEEELNDRLIGAIDGVGVEELFYNGGFEPDDYRLQMLLRARAKIPILVADYIDNNANYNQAAQYNLDAGFIPFPRRQDNYDYQYIPDTVINENTDNVAELSQAKNYLYLISSNAFADKATYLSAIQQTNFDVVIIDGFYGDEMLTATEVTSLKTKANGGTRRVIAYMSVGSAEKYRYYWQEDWKLHHPRWLKKEYDGYEDEVWVKFWKKDWKEIIFGNDDSYTKKLINSGFDGTYLDNVEAFYFLYYDE